MIAKDLVLERDQLPGEDSGQNVAPDEGSEGDSVAVGIATDERIIQIVCKESWVSPYPLLNGQVILSFIPNEAPTNTATNAVITLLGR